MVLPIRHQDLLGYWMNRQSCWARDLTITLASSSKARDQIALGVKDLNTVIASICNKHSLSGRQQGHTGGRRKMTFFAALAAKLAQKGSIAVKHLYAVVVGICYIDITIGRINSNSLRSVELAVEQPWVTKTDLANQVAAVVKDLNSVIVGVCHNDLTCQGDGYSRGALQLTVVVSFCSKLVRKLALQIKDLDTVITRISHENALRKSRASHSQTGRGVELAVFATLRTKLANKLARSRIENLDSVIIGICDQNIGARSGQSDGTWGLELALFGTSNAWSLE